MLDINVLENMFEAGPPLEEGEEHWRCDIKAKIRLMNARNCQLHGHFQRTRKSQLYTMTLVQQLELDSLPIVDNEQDQIDMLIALQSKHRAEVIDMYQQHQALYEKLSAYYDEWA